MIPSIIIEKKRDGEILSNKEIKWFIESHMKNEIDDCQMSALLMAIYIRGMIDDELFFFILTSQYLPKKAYIFYFH